MNRRLSRALTLLVPLCVSLWSDCARQPLAGGSSQQGNGIVMGAVVDTTGAPVSRARVVLLPASYDPVKDTAAPIVSIADSAGRYVFSRVDSGAYTIEAVHRDKRTRALVSGIYVMNDTVPVSNATLLKPGAIHVTLPGGSDAAGGYVYVPGTFVFAYIGANGGFVTLDSVPAGAITSVNYEAMNSSAQKTIRYDISVASGDTLTIQYPEWKYARTLYLNTTASGAAITGNVTDFPVLVRLTQKNFDFSQASAGGADLRFTKPDGAQLPYEIERFDPVTGHAEAWVKVDTVFGNDSTHSLVMYWGASTPSTGTSASNSAAVFDTANGFQGVWHLAEAGNAGAMDATINGYNGTPFGMTASSAVSGAIGAARNFNGASCYIQMTGTAISKLNFNQNDFYTVSVWVLADTLDYGAVGTVRRDMTIIAKDNCQYSLKCFRTNFEFNQYNDSAGWQASFSPAITATWKYIVGVRAGTKQYLYVDGICTVDSVNSTETSTRARSTASDVMIGKTPPGSNNWSPYFFKGNIDEVRMCNKALSADWIKLCYMNQRVDDKLIVIK